jgi:RNA polymerase sigma-70 factor (ECF subfamily)
MAAATEEAPPTEASFDALLDAQRRRLYGIAYSILRDHGEAEDALQEALLKAWRGWDRVRSESARPTWLARICVNHCINRRRGLRVRGIHNPMSDREPAPSDPRFGGRLVDLDRSYLRLSPRQRAAVFLHYHHGYSIDECADLMGCGSGSVRTHLARAIASMREEMSDA